MGQVEVKDHNIWIKHIVGDESLKQRLELLAPNETVRLEVDGQEGLWQRMGAYRTTGYATPGLTPIGPAKAQWKTLYASHRGALVDIRLASGIEVPEAPRREPARRWEEASEADREAAWEAFRALWSAGWKSDRPYGSRDELYDRDER